MLGLQWLARMAHWAHHPPSMRRVVVVLVAIALCAVLVAVDKAGLWPAWLHVNTGTGTRIRLR